MKKTLQRINKALNLRFVKESSLYIEKETVEDIKKYIFKNETQNIAALAKKYSYEIVAKTVIKNCFLLTYVPKSRESREWKEVLSPIFRDIDMHFFNEISRDVVENNVYCTVDFKNYVLEYAIKTYDNFEVEKRLQDVKTRSIEERFIYFNHLIKSEFISKGLLSTIRKILKFFTLSDDLQKYIENNHADFIRKFFEQGNAHDKIASIKFIIENCIKEDKDNIWERAILLEHETTFDAIFNYVNLCPVYDNYTTKTSIRKLLPIISEFILENTFLENTRNCYSINPKIRIFFLDMISGNNIKNPRLKLGVIKIIEDIYFPPKWQERLDKIKNGSNEQNEDIISNILNGSHNFENRNTLNYFCSKINESHLPELLSYDINKQVIAVLAYYFANKIDKISDYNSSISQELRQNIASMIIKYHLKNKKTIAFLEDNKFYDHLEQFNGR